VHVSELELLRERLGDAHVGRRLRGQVDEMAQLGGQGEGGFHFENLPFFCHVVRGALTLSGLAGLGRRQALAFETLERDILVRNLPEKFESLRILHLSDLHLDATEGFGEALARAIDTLEFDLAVITGDFRFHDTGRYAHLAKELEGLAPALDCEFGALGVLGNHDFLEMVPIVEGAGVSLLLNESRVLRRGDAALTIVGVDDAHLYGCHDLDKALAEAPEGSPRILLVHSPEIADEAAGAGIDLYLAGHTHGGQICLPGRVPLLVNARCDRSQVSGAWEHAGMHGYTSRGVGASGVFARFFCPPELVIHRLVSGEGT
jgi:predicted MPP superfamily phosphohydrolase